MKIKLKDKDNPISSSSGWCFINTGFCSTIIESINSGKEVELESPPQSFLDGGYLVQAKSTKKESK